MAATSFPGKNYLVRQSTSHAVVASANTTSSGRSSELLLSELHAIAQVDPSDRFGRLRAQDVLDTNPTTQLTQPQSALRFVPYSPLVCRPGGRERHPPIKDKQCANIIATFIQATDSVIAAAARRTTQPPELEARLLDAIAAVHEYIRTNSLPRESLYASIETTTQRHLMQQIKELWERGDHAALHSRTLHDLAVAHDCLPYLHTFCDKIHSMPSEADLRRHDALQDTWEAFLRVMGTHHGMFDPSHLAGHGSLYSVLRDHMEPVAKHIATDPSATPQHIHALCHIATQMAQVIRDVFAVRTSSTLRSVYSTEDKDRLTVAEHNAYRTLLRSLYDHLWTALQRIDNLPLRVQLYTALFQALSIQRQLSISQERTGWPSHYMLIEGAARDVDPVLAHLTAITSLLPRIPDEAARAQCAVHVATCWIACAQRSNNMAWTPDSTPDTTNLDRMRTARDILVRYAGTQDAPIHPGIASQGLLLFQLMENCVWLWVRYLEYENISPDTASTRPKTERRAFLDKDEVTGVMTTLMPVLHGIAARYRSAAPAAGPMAIGHVHIAQRAEALQERAIKLITAAPGSRQHASLSTLRDDAIAVLSALPIAPIMGSMPCVPGRD